MRETNPASDALTVERMGFSVCIYVTVEKIQIQIFTIPRSVVYRPHEASFYWFYVVGE